MAHILLTPGIKTEKKDQTNPKYDPKFMCEEGKRPRSHGMREPKKFVNDASTYLRKLKKMFDFYSTFDEMAVRAEEQKCMLRSDKELR